MDSRWMERIKRAVVFVGLGCWGWGSTWAFTPEKALPFVFRPLRSLTRLQLELPSALARRSSARKERSPTPSVDVLPTALFQVLSSFGEKLYGYRAIHDGIPLETGMRFRFLRRGFKPLVLGNRVAPFSRTPVRLSYPQALEQAKAWVHFEENVDQDVSAQAEDDLTYGLDSMTQTQHLMYHYWFYVDRLQDFVHVKIDAHTGEVIAAYLNRYYDQEVHLQADVLESHPIYRTPKIPLEDLKVNLVSDTQQQTVFTAKQGQLIFDDTVTETQLVFENRDLRTLLNRSPAQLSKAKTYQYHFPVNDLKIAQAHLENVIPMSILMAFSSLTSVKQQGDGWMNSEKTRTSALPVVVDYTGGGECNAYFSPGFQQQRPPHLVFYAAEQDQCRAAAQSNSILLHEWGHYLDYLTAGITDAATSEGIGDVLSLLYTRQPWVAPDFLQNAPQSYIRDLRIDHQYPLHKGQIHFEGQILASTLWDLVTLWRGVYDEEKIFPRLQEVFLKALLMASHQLDFHQILIALLDETPEDSTWSHWQCSTNDIFSQHGLATREKTCLNDQPTLAISLETPQTGFFASGDTLSPLIKVTPPRSGLTQEGLLTLSLWEDDILLARTQAEVLLGPDAIPVEQSFDITLPPTVSIHHRYELRATFTDQKHIWVMKRLAFPIDRVFLRSVQYVQKKSTPIRRGWQEIPLQLSGDGWIEGPIQIQLHIKIPDDRERISLALGSSDGKVFYFAKNPESVKAIANRRHVLPYLFQGDPVSNLDRLIVIDDEKYPSGLSIESIELRIEAYQSAP